MRGKKIELVETPPILEPIRDNGNGEIIPVNYRDIDMYYDTKAKKYFITAKVGLHKIVLEEISRN